jgi:long-chain acyl-CoA synthetase
MAATNPFLYLQKNADENPNGVFLQSPVQSITNAEAVVHAKKVAYELRRLGVKAGDIVALDLPDQLSIIFTEAVYHEGGTSTVIPDGALPDDRVGVTWLFSNRPNAVTVPPTAQLVAVDQRFLQQVEENPYGISPSEEHIEILRIVFSSGTTGRPNAVPMSRAMEMMVDAGLPMWFQVSPTLILMDTGTAWGIGEFFMSVKGAQPFLSVGGASSSAIIDLAERARAKTIKGSPAQIIAVVDELERQGRTLPSVEAVVIAGTVMPTLAAERTRAAMEGCTIMINYGSTEAGGATTRLTASDDPYDAGHVNPGSVVEIVDEDDEPVAPGTVGRIRHRSIGMTHSYLGNPEATERAFRDGWFYPGDLGFFREDGGLQLTGRESELINAGGVKVDPNRIDHVALAHEGVTDACSFEFVGPTGVAQIGLALVAEDALDVRALSRALAAEFGNAAPALLARVDEIPRGRTGKPLRRELAATYSR